MRKNMRDTSPRDVSKCLSFLGFKNDKNKLCADVDVHVYERKCALILVNLRTDQKQNKQRQDKEILGQAGSRTHK